NEVGFLEREASRVQALEDLVWILSVDRYHDQGQPRSSRREEVTQAFLRICRDVAANRGSEKSVGSENPVPSGKSRRRLCVDNAKENLAVLHTWHDLESLHAFLALLDEIVLHDLVRKISELVIASDIAQRRK